MIMNTWDKAIYDIYGFLISEFKVVENFFLDFGDTREATGVQACIAIVEDLRATLDRHGKVGEHGQEHDGATHERRG